MEQVTGKALQGRRSDAVVISRAVSREPAALAADVDTSLKNLKTDYIDVYQLHDVTRPADVEKVPELLKTLRKAQEQGKVRFIGISTHGAAEDVRAMIATGDVEAMTISYNVTQHKRSLGDGEDMSRFTTDVLPFAKEHDVGVSIMKPLGGSRLAQPGPCGEPPVSPMKAIRYVVENQLISAVTPGVGTMEHLLEDLPAGDPANALSADEIRGLEEQGRSWGLYFCRQCGYCMPCEQEITIPQMMTLQEQLREAKDLSSLKEQYAKFAVKAEACIQCGRCEERCPYGLPIQERLKQLDGALG